MRFGESPRRLFVWVVAIIFALILVSNYLDWRVGPSDYYRWGSGLASTSDDQKITLTMYELNAGDLIYYEYEASEECWFVIYTVDRIDPLDIKIDERVNLTGTQNEGSFECPVDGEYYLRVTFLGTLPEGSATIDYYTHALNDSSVLVMAAESVILMALSSVLVYLAYSDYRWGYGGSLYKALGAAGGILATALPIISYFSPTVLDGDLSFEVLSWSAGLLLTLCFWVGLFTIAWEEEGEAVIHIGGRSLSLVKVVAVITVIVLVCGMLVMIYAFNYVK